MALMYNGHRRADSRESIDEKDSLRGKLNESLREVVNTGQSSKNSLQRGSKMDQNCHRQN